MDIPIENKRIKKIIERYCNGNKLQFSNRIGVSHPRIHRLFTIDKRNGTYPLVSFEIIQAIATVFTNINSEWLITGKGSMLKEEEEKNENKVDNDIINVIDEPVIPYSKVNDSNNDVVDLLKDKIALLEEIKFMQANEIALCKDGYCSFKEQAIRQL